MITPSPIAPLDPRPFTPPALTGLSADQHSFGELLTAERFAQRAGASDQAKDAAQKLVAAALVLPMLKQFREMNSAAPPFAPSQGEKSFRAFMDQELAGRLVSAGRWPLVDAVRDKLLRRGVGAGASA